MSERPDVFNPAFTRVHVTYEVDGTEYRVTYDVANHEHRGHEARSRNESTSEALEAYREACDTGTAKNVRIEREGVE